MTNDLSELPDGWTWCKGKDLFTFIRGVSYKKEDAQSKADSNCVAILRAGNLQNGRVLAEDLIYVPSRYVSDLQRLRSGDLIVAMSSGSASVVGKVAVAEIDLPDTAFGTFCGGLRAHIADFRRWLFHFFQTSKYRSFISSEAAGININNLRAEHLLGLDIPLPPMPELNRLVAKIEALQARSRKAREALDSIPTLLEQFRQSVLAAAFRGDITAEWRENHPDIEPASVLLERIRQERRRKWEEANPRKKYVEPEPIDDSDLHELPVGWVWATVEEIADAVEYGTSAKTTEDRTGVPVLRMGNILNGELDTGDLKFLPEAHEEFPHLLLAPGDVLFNRTNSAELVGKAAVYEGDLSPCSFASYLLRVRVCGLLPLLLATYINSPFGRAWVKSVVNQQVGQANVNGSKLRRLAVPIPPMKEQQALCTRLRRVITAERQIARDLLDLAVLLRSLDQSILAKALRGELVPQDPADEPASVLLERIRAATNGQTQASTSKKRRRRSEA